MALDTETSRAPRAAQPLDVALNRAEVKWTRKELAGRVLWGLCQPFFRWSPRPLWGWRRLILRIFGAEVGAGAHVYPSVKIAIPWNLRIAEGTAVGDHAILYSLGEIRLDERATVSQYAHLCAGTHALGQPQRPLVKATVRVGADAWVCADSFIGPGVEVGACAVVGARAVVVRDVPPGALAVGNPARLEARGDGEEEVPR